MFSKHLHLKHWRGDPWDTFEKGLFCLIMVSHLMSMSKDIMKAQASTGSVETDFLQICSSETTLWRLINAKLF